MSTSKKSLLAAVLVVCGTGVSAEELLPGFVRQTADTGPVSQVSLAAGLMVSVSDVEPAAYLAEAAAAAPGRAHAPTGVPLPSGRWSPTLAPAAAATAEQVDLYELIDTLNALGPIGVSVADYLALALPKLDTSPNVGSSPPPAHASKAGSYGLTKLQADSAPSVWAVPAARASKERAKSWALPPEVSELLTRVLVGAAALAILAGAGLRLAVMTRRRTRRSLARL